MKCCGTCAYWDPGIPHYIRLVPERLNRRVGECGYPRPPGVPEALQTTVMYEDEGKKCSCWETEEREES